MSWFTKNTRKNDWQYKLNSVFDHYENTDFIWGQTDCFCFASDCIKAMTGKGPMDGFKYLYDTEEQAYKFLDEGTTAPEMMLLPYMNEPATGSRIPSISTGGAAIKAMMKQVAAAIRHGIMMTPNHPT